MSNKKKKSRLLTHVNVGENGKTGDYGNSNEP